MNAVEPVEIEPKRRAFRSVSATELGYPRISAWLDVGRYADKLRAAARELPPARHALALELLSDQRMYCFERNTARWPDGKFYLLNRSYQFWRGHKIGFTGAELDAIGLREWDQRVIRVAHGANFYPMQAECFQYEPRQHLASFVALVERLEDLVNDWAHGRMTKERTA